MAELTLPGPDNDDLSEEDVCQMLHISPKQLQRLIHQGLFPPGIKYTPRSQPRWRALDIATFRYNQMRGCRPGNIERILDDEEEEKKS